LECRASSTLGDECLEHRTASGRYGFLIPRPPSAYLRRFYYDCLTHSEAALRLVIDTVGADRVVLGTDWPVFWVLGLQSLTQEEKEMILWKNLERLLGL
jgi:aminocarboxymuconate-semialdehyde decarboxylase